MALHYPCEWRRDSRSHGGLGDGAPGWWCCGRDGLGCAYRLMSVHVHDVHAFCMDVTSYLLL